MRSAPSRTPPTQASMPNFLSLPYELKLLILLQVPRVHRECQLFSVTPYYLEAHLYEPVVPGLATLCRELLPLVRQCISNDIWITDYNIHDFLVSSRSLAHTYLQNTEKVSLGRISISNPLAVQSCLWMELFEHIRPVFLHCDFWLTERALGEIDVSRLREWHCRQGDMADVLQRSSTTLRKLEIDDISYPKAFAAVTSYPPMIALTSLTTNFREPFQVEDSVYDDFFRFLSSCVNLCSLTLESRKPSTVYRAITCHGKKLAELYVAIRIVSDDSASLTTIDFASSCPELRILSIYAPEMLLRGPYPPTLHGLKLLGARFEFVQDLLTQLQEPDGLPDLSDIDVYMYEAPNEEDDILDEDFGRFSRLANGLVDACEARGIVCNIEIPDCKPDTADLRLCMGNSLRTSRLTVSRLYRNLAPSTEWE